MLSADMRISFQSNFSFYHVVWTSIPIMLVSFESHFRHDLHTLWHLDLIRCVVDLISWSMLYPQLSWCIGITSLSSLLFFVHRWWFMTVHTLLLYQWLHIPFIIIIFFLSLHHSIKRYKTLPLCEIMPLCELVAYNCNPEDLQPPQVCLDGYNPSNTYIDPSVREWWVQQHRLFDPFTHSSYCPWYEEGNRLLCRLDWNFWRKYCQLT